MPASVAPTKLQAARRGGKNAEISRTDADAARGLRSHPSGPCGLRQPAERRHGLAVGDPAASLPLCSGGAALPPAVTVSTGQRAARTTRPDRAQQRVAQTRAPRVAITPRWKASSRANEQISPSHDALAQVGADAGGASPPGCQAHHTRRVPGQVYRHQYLSAGFTTPLSWWRARRSGAVPPVPRRGYPLVARAALRMRIDRRSSADPSRSSGTSYVRIDLSTRATACASRDRPRPDEALAAHDAVS